MGRTVSVLSLARFVWTRVRGGYSVRNLCLSLTDQCNLRCRMCDIWSTGQGQNMGLDIVRRIVNSPALRGVSSVSITGGEPFMRDDLADIVKSARLSFPGCRVSVSTNGTLKERTLSLLSEVGEKGMTIHVSIDGEQAHDRIRGRKGCLELAKETIKAIRDEYPCVDIETKFTITPWNCGELEAAFGMSQGLGTRFSVKAAQVNRNYTNRIKKTQRRAFCLDTKKRRQILAGLRRIRNKFIREGRLMDTLYLTMLMGYVRSDGKTVMPLCRCAFDSLFVLPDGQAFSCRKMRPIGDLSKEALSEILSTSRAKRAGKKRRAGQCPECMSLYGFYS